MRGRQGNQGGSYLIPKGYSLFHLQSAQPSARKKIENLQQLLQNYASAVPAEAKRLKLTHSFDEICEIYPLDMICAEGEAITITRMLQVQNL